MIMVETNRRIRQSEREERERERWNKTSEDYKKMGFPRLIGTNMVDMHHGGEKSFTWSFRSSTDRFEVVFLINLFNEVFAYFVAETLFN